MKRIWKGAVCAVLACVAVFAFAVGVMFRRGITAHADESMVSGIYENVSWKLDLDAGVLTVFGEGAIADIEEPADAASSTLAWFLYHERIFSVVIEQGITAVGMNAFGGLPYLTHVTFSPSVEHISKSAFRNCPTLKSLTFSEGLKEIDSFAFMDCSNLEALYFPNSLQYIRLKAFFNCTDLETVEFGSGLLDLGDWSFQNCPNILSLDIPDLVTEIRDDTFNPSPALKYLRIGDGVKVIGKNAFFGCISLQDVHIGKNVRSIGENALWRSNILVSYRVYIHSPAIALQLSAPTSCGELIAGARSIMFDSAIIEISPYIQEKWPNVVTFSNKDDTYVSYSVKPHVWSRYMIPSLSCSQAGFEGKICDECYVIQGYETFAHNYVFECVDERLHKEKCSACGDVKGESVHAWGEGEEVLPPTHTQPGEVLFSCLDCRTQKREEIAVLPAHSYTQYECYDDEQHMCVCACLDWILSTHVWDEVEIIQPSTHLQEGLSVYACRHCQAQKQGAAPINPEHAFGEWEICLQPTEAAEGERVRVCACGAEEREAIPSLEHEYKSSVVAPTCSEQGYTEHVCIHCGETYKDNYIEKLAHTYSSKKDINCNVCNQVRIALAKKQARTRCILWIAGGGCVVSGAVAVFIVFRRRKLRKIAQDILRENDF